MQYTTGKCETQLTDEKQERSRINYLVLGVFIVVFSDGTLATYAKSILKDIFEDPGLRIENFVIIYTDMRGVSVNQSKRQNVSHSPGKTTNNLFSGIIFQALCMYGMTLSKYYLQYYLLSKYYLQCNTYCT